MHFLLILTVAVTSSAPPPAPVKAVVNPKEADALFTQARALIKAGNVKQACPLLEKSHALDPALGTLLNLSDCYETTGRLVQAFLSFNEAAAWASRNHESSRADIARARAAGLKSRLSWLALSAHAAAPGLTVSVNDFDVELGSAAQSVPVEPGELTLIANAPGRETWTTTVSVGPRQTVAVDVPMLLAQAELKRPSDIHAFEATLSPAPMVVSEPVASAPLQVTAPLALAPNRAPAIGLLAAGAAVAATGIVGLGWSFNTYDRLQAQQPGQPEFTNPTVSREDLATLRWVYPASWITAAVGVATAAGGMIWFLKGSQTSLAVVPTSNGMALSASGTF